MAYGALKLFILFLKGDIIVFYFICAHGYFLNHRCYFSYFIPYLNPSLAFACLWISLLVKSADYSDHLLGISERLILCCFDKIASRFYARLFPEYGRYIRRQLLFPSLVRKQWFLPHRSLPDTNEFVCRLPKEPYILEFLMHQELVFISHIEQCRNLLNGGSLGHQVRGFKAWYPGGIYFDCGCIKVQW